MPSVAPSGHLNSQISSSQSGYGLTAPNSVANNIPKPHMTTARPQESTPVHKPQDSSAPYFYCDNDKAILGDVGVPYLLLSIPLPSSDMTMRLGTPNYMAPEQWQPEVRGPMSFKTDSWGFGCSIVEILTGVQPWSGKSADEIYDLVVRKQEKLSIPNGIPPPLENLLRGCFMYDLRSRPSMNDILHDHLRVGDTVRSRKPTNSFKLENMDVPEGIVVGLERETDPDEYALVKFHGIHDPLRVHVSVLERVTNGLASRDWVRLKEGEDKRNSLVGIIHQESKVSSTFTFLLFHKLSNSFLIIFCDILFIVLGFQACTFAETEIENTQKL
ncbi:unnamed protein product [Eruca vesicaria subsp. sativa]|uniref:Protein kinase domain-containing protein n=1 Tax=Eruca vesicaria subsp. sativa TaxID=29727 RepID=A0ABC8J9N6_ERUVS|nr:unnamed protein product [Eruca vesicaria subsp. sativa]